MGTKPDRRKAAGTAATLIGGSAEIMDFLIPLWGGIELGIAPSALVVSTDTTELRSSQKQS